MFGHKHVFTCPDVMYLRSQQQRNNRIAIISVVVTSAAMFLYGTYLERKENNDNVTELKAVQND